VAKKDGALIQKSRFLRRLLVYQLRRCGGLLARATTRALVPRPKNSWARNVFVIRTHLLTDPCLALYTKFVEEFGPDQVFLLYDETKTSLDQALLGNGKAAGTIARDRIIPVSETVCRRLSPLHRNAMYSAAAHVICASKGVRGTFGFLWLVEGDVYCHGSIKQCLQPTLRSDADFLAKPTGEPTQQVFRCPDANPKWPWWRSLEGNVAEVPLRQRKGCFFPVIRCSRDFVDLLERRLANSSGYCEVYFPTLCHSYGMRLCPLPASIFGEFRHRPPVNFKRIITSPDDNRLYHPVKSFAS
jgi:hypothetical protein